MWIKKIFFWKKKEQKTEKFVPADESTLSDEWLFPEEVIRELRLCRNSYLDHVKGKLLPYSMIGKKVYHNRTDIRHMMIYLRRKSLLLITPLLWCSDVFDIIFS
jgi:hypothetical protein